MAMQAGTIASLPDDLLTEILLRLPSPASLARAALASKRWYGVASTPDFLSRFRAGHTSSPLLGLFVSHGHSGLPVFHPASPVRSDPDLAAAVRGGDFSLTRLEEDPDWCLRDCRDGRLLLSRGTSVSIYDPMSHLRVSVCRPQDDPFQGTYIADCLLRGRDDDGPASFRVVSVQQHRRRMRASEYDSGTLQWRFHQWVENIKCKRYEDYEAMQAAGLIFWKCQEHSFLLLDTSSMEFSMLPLPVAIFQPSRYAIGEFEDGVCCLVGLDGTSMEDVQLKVWLLRENKNGGNRWGWELQQGMPVSMVLGTPDGVHRVRMMAAYKVRMVAAGLALVYKDKRHPQFAIDLKNLCLKAEFNFSGELAYLFQMPWPPAALVTTGTKQAMAAEANNNQHQSPMSIHTSPCRSSSSTLSITEDVQQMQLMHPMEFVPLLQTTEKPLDRLLRPHEPRGAEQVIAAESKNLVATADMEQLMATEAQNFFVTEKIEESMSCTLDQDHPYMSQHASDLVRRAAPASGISSLNASSSTNGPLDMGIVGCIDNYSSPSRENNKVGGTVSLGCDNSNIGDAILTCRRFPDQDSPCVGGDKLCSSNLNVICSPQMSEERSLSRNIPQDKTSHSPDYKFSKEEKPTQSVSRFGQELNEYPIGCAIPTAPRMNYYRNWFTSISHTIGDGSKLWPEDIVLTAFVGGSKKPQSPVSCSVSPRSDVLGLKHRGHLCKIQSHSSAKTSDAKKLPDNTNSGQSSSESLTCVANVLVTVGDRGWREYDTQITIDTDGHDQRICVKLAEGTKYAHMVCQVLQRGATNPYTHAMMWKGVPEWYLEFPDRSQWLVFKQMHDKYYSHNIRGASVKNTPIPSVRLVEGDDDNDVVSFVRPQDYLGHIGTDVKMALHKSRVLYGMENDDKEWISRWRKCSGGYNSTACELTEDLLEKVMNKFEKLAYSHKCNDLTIDQLRELNIDNVPLGITKVIHGYWQDKRQKKGMPFIRHFQIYEQQLQESTVNRIQGSSNVYQEKMLAFGLRPCGLRFQTPFREPKQRSRKKTMYTVCHSFSRKQDGFYWPGRKYNEYAGDGRTCESYDGFPLRSPTGYSPRFSMRADSPRAFDASERGSTPLLFRTNSAERNASFALSEDHQTSPSFRHKKIKRGALDHRDTGIHERQNLKHLFSGPSYSHCIGIEELKLRDAAGAAQHAATMAKLKRERAHCLMQKADLALHKASLALMIADAIRASNTD